jgi:hypothetical protein
MREKKFTAGKWIVKSWDGEEWPEKRISIGPENIAVMISPRYAAQEQMKYDAALIAAAPELLEALEAVMVYVDEASYWLIPDGLRYDLEQSIAKAYGES